MYKPEEAIRSMQRTLKWFYRFIGISLFSGFLLANAIVFYSSSSLESFSWIVVIINTICFVLSIVTTMALLLTLLSQVSSAGKEPRCCL